MERTRGQDSEPRRRVSRAIFSESTWSFLSFPVKNCWSQGWEESLMKLTNDIYIYKKMCKWQRQENIMVSCLINLNHQKLEQMNYQKCLGLGHTKAKKSPKCWLSGSKPGVASWGHELIHFNDGDQPRVPHHEGCIQGWVKNLDWLLMDILCIQTWLAYKVVVTWCYALCHRGANPSIYIYTYI